MNSDVFSVSPYTCLLSTSNPFHVNLDSQNSAMFSITREVAADTGIHLGDGHLFIRQNGADTNYSYDITGNAIEDQLYLLSHVIPTIESAYNLHKFGVYLNRERTWMSIVFQSKNVALFKHRVLGLPNGRKINPSIPPAILIDDRLMKCFVREILATDGVLGFCNASRNQPHKYPRIQIKMTARAVIEEVAKFLKERLSISVSCRLNAEPGGCGRRPRHIIQINRSADIDTWRKEIGFSNPSHISRMMVFEEIGECPPRTSIVDRLSFLTGCTPRLRTSGPITESAFESAISKMTLEFGSPVLNALRTVERIQKVNLRLQSLARELPRIVELRTAGT